MRILVVARYFWPDLGGAQVQLRSLARQWAEDGHDVTILTCRWKQQWSSDERIEGYRVHRLPVTETRFLGTLRFVWQIRRWLWRRPRDFDVVMVSMLKHAAYAAVGVGRRAGFPVFLKSWGAGDSGDMAWQESARLGQCIRRGTLDVAGVFAPSEAVAREIILAGYPKVVLIPNGVAMPDRPWSLAETISWRRKLGLADRPTLLTTGRLSPEKGVEDLLRAMPVITSRCPNVQLVMVGEGPLRGHLEAMIREQLISNHVQLVGATTDVEAYLRAADLYVLPSRFEGLSVALLEALILGMPAVISDTPANQGVLPRDLLPTFATENPEALAMAVVRRLEEIPALEQRLSLARNQTAERFGIQVVAREHITHFARTCRREIPPGR